MEVDTLAEKTPETKLASLISYLLHPLLMSSYGFTFLFFSNNYISDLTPLKLKVVILVVTFIFTFLLPTINAFILLKMGRIKSLEMETSTERIIPYSSTAIYYFALFYLFHHENFPAFYKESVIDFLNILILGATVSILLTLIINFKWKISAHTIGIGGLTGGVLGMMYRLQMDLHFLFIALVVFSGIVAYARLKLKAHTPAQVYTGFALGFIVEFGLMLFL
jgi:membrane-associated phospholipid phosphatase